jgi:hypothetical protein
MKKLISVMAILPLFVGLAVAAETDESFKIIHVQDLAELLSKQPNSTWIYDADPARVREQEGVIPGARLLSSSSSYDLSDLPGSKDSKLVFYCHNTYWNGLP